ncbi:MAG: hypothetical protein ABL949_16380 [Fimbriimonadaceae bacterium]
MKIHLHLLILSSICFCTGSEAGTPAEEQISQLLEKRCAECHAPEVKDAEDPPLNGKTNLSELRGSSKYVVPGNAEKSRFFKKIILPDDDEDRMPKSSGAKGSVEYREPLSSAEIALFKDWIDGEPEKGNVATARSFITEADIQEVIQKDLESSPGNTINRRYFTLANWYNATDERGGPLVDDKTLNVYRSAISKSVNSLSWESTIVKPEPIDESKTIFRINLEDYGWTPEVWERIAKFYPYTLLADSPASQLIKAATGTSRGVLRADWFVYATSQAPLYHQILGMPGDIVQNAEFLLEKKLGFDYARALQDGGAVRSGFEQSGVSQGNRIIERVTFTYARGGLAYYWKSYDFDKNNKEKPGGDIFKAPLGPKTAGLTSNGTRQFSHAGGEIVFSLPNGLQAYLLVDARGARLNEAPTNIVHDQNRTDGRIINGISCMGCHKNGMFATTPKDEVLTHALALPLDDKEEAQIKRLYSQAKMDAAIEADTKSFNEALSECDVDENGVEPLNALYGRFIADIRLPSLAAEIGGAGSSSSDIIGILGQKTNTRVKEIAAKLLGGNTVPRLSMLIAHKEIIKELGLGVILDFASLNVPEFGGKDLRQLEQEKPNRFLRVQQVPAPPSISIGLPPLGGNGGTTRTGPSSVIGPPSSIGPKLKKPVEPPGLSIVETKSARPVVNPRPIVPVTRGATPLDSDRPLVRRKPDQATATTSQGVVYKATPIGQGSSQKSSQVTSAAVLSKKN